uniref:Uncharacterized protein n=1 Tax=Onchocerca volvulus TaxID=6282 RepID=A0A8R1XV54_ONCVO
MWPRYPNKQTLTECNRSYDLLTLNGMKYDRLRLDHLVVSITATSIFLESGRIIRLDSSQIEMGRGLLPSLELAFSLQYKGQC